MQSVFHAALNLYEQAAGDEVAEYDLIMEVDTETLTDSAYKVGKFAGTVTLVVESQARAMDGFPGWHPLFVDHMNSTKAYSLCI
jgi:hypothetical protein